MSVFSNTMRVLADPDIRDASGITYSNWLDGDAEDVGVLNGELRCKPNPSGDGLYPVGIAYDGKRKEPQVNYGVWSMAKSTFPAPYKLKDELIQTKAAGICGDVPSCSLETRINKLKKNQLLQGLIITVDSYIL